MINATRPTDVISLIRKKVSETLLSHKMSLRMGDVDGKLLSLYNIITDKIQFEHQKKQYLKILNHTIFPYIRDFLDILSSSTNLLAPITGTNYVNTINER